MSPQGRTSFYIAGEATQQCEFALTGKRIPAAFSLLKAPVLQFFISSITPSRRMGSEWANSSKGQLALSQTVEILVPPK